MFLKGPVFLATAAWHGTSIPQWRAAQAVSRWWCWGQRAASARLGRGVNTGGVTSAIQGLPHKYHKCAYLRLKYTNYWVFSAAQVQGPLLCLPSQRRAPPPGRRHSPDQTVSPNQPPSPRTHLASPPAADRRTAPLPHLGSSPYNLFLNKMNTY